MTPRIRQPGPPLQAPFLDEQRRLDVGLAPRFDFVHTSPTAFSIVPPRTWMGTDRLILPFHQWRDGYAARVSHPILFEDTAATGSITLATSGIGGRVDGVALAASGVYLIWAFLADLGSPTLVGPGITRRPDYNAVIPGGGIALGATGAVLTMSVAGQGNCYTVGSRIIVRNGTALSSEYNQATITAISAAGTTITADFDAAYTGVSAATINTALTAGTTRQVIQLDRHAPWVTGSTRGTFGSYPFALLGTAEVDAASLLINVRCPGEPRFMEVPVTILSLAGTGVATTTICLRRWLGRHVRRVYVEGAIAVASSNGGNATIMGMDGGLAYGRFFTGSTNAATNTARATDVLPVGAPFSTIRSVITVDGVTTVNASMVLRGWDEGAF